MADIKALTANDPSLLQSAQAAYRRYNEEQLATVKLPGRSEDVCQCPDASGENIRILTGQEQVLVSSHNSLGDDRYYDVESSSLFMFDHNARVC